MSTYYNSKIILEILKKFNAKKIIISGLTDQKILNEIKNYNAQITTINTTELTNITTIKEHPLNALSNLKEYDAIFIDDDANWYTLFNELNIIKKTNKKFPLVFICNNKFPNKRRDSYINPDKIPTKFRQEYINEIPIYYNSKKITISDGHYHATKENTPKNGILTAIEDFLVENNHIGIMDINFIDEITILYLKIQINEKRIKSIIKNSEGCKINELEFTDKLIENKLLVSYITKFNISNKNLSYLEVENNKKDNIINDYKNKIKSQNNKIDYTESKINSIESKIDLKNTKIKDLETKLFNKEKKIKHLRNKLNDTTNSLHKLESKFNNQIDTLTKEIIEEKRNYKNKEAEYKNKEAEYKNKIIIANSQINFLKEDLSKKEFNQIKLEKHVQNNNDKKLIIKEKDTQIKEKNKLIDQITKEKNNQNETLNNKINELKTKITEKDTQIKYKQQKLINTENNLISLKQQNKKQISKIENNDYCINCFKEEISNKNLEINYLNNNNLTKKILNPFTYFYLILKSKPKEIYLNLKLYRTLKNSSCFDIGFYLNKNKDLIESNWCKYFSPELHYVCNGFEENRKFNKKYFNRKSKQDLLKYLLTCEK